DQVPRPGVLGASVELGEVRQPRGAEDAGVRIEPAAVRVEHGRLHRGGRIPRDQPVTGGQLPAYGRAVAGHDDQVVRLVEVECAPFDLVARQDVRPGQRVRDPAIEARGELVPQQYPDPIRT